MKITFQPTENPEIGNQSNISKREVKSESKAYSHGAVFGKSRENGWFGGGVKEKAKSFAELQQEAAYTDAAIMQDYKTLLSNTMSEEDYAKLEEEGFDFSAMDPETAVTIVDKIKAELARSGQHIAGYTDDLDMDTLAAALGSESLASAVSESFDAADIPLTEENIHDVKKAWDMAEQVSEPGEGTYHYMVDNGMEPEIQNFYLAQNSGAAGTAAQPKYYAEDIQGYYAETAKSNSSMQLQGEIEKLLLREGLLVNEENCQTAEALLEGGLPITKENIRRLQELESVEFPVTERAFAEAVTNALVEGKAPIHANLAKNSNLYETAAQLVDYFWDDAAQAHCLEDITSRRQLEEIRLRMSAEVNVKLLKSGFSIDTAPMEQLVEALRKAEAEVAAHYFPQDADAVPKYELLRDTTAVIKELPGMPAQLLGPWSIAGADGTLSEFHAEGRELQETYAKAQTSYEALMTAPRRDLGDSIRKAFANVDEILKDLGLEPVETNRRAVRVLGYNRMAMNQENVARVQAADAQVKTVVEKMTPAATLKMIRDGKNPLEMSFDELETYFNELPEEYEQNAESYSRFLYGLEQNKQITEEERSAYIGIYRMLHQIDVSDGAAIGALVNIGAELHFSNLLSAVRSGKFKSMDVSVTESFGGTMELIRKGESITEQIAKGFVNSTKELLTEVSHDEAANETYNQEELVKLRQAAQTSAEGVELLLRAHLPQSADNLLAAQALAAPSYNPFKEWKMKKTQLSENMQTAEELPDAADVDLIDSLDDKEAFKTQYNEMLDTMKKQVQEMSLQQADTSMDVRSMKLLCKQLGVAGKMAEAEEYIFPMYIGEELTKVHLTLAAGGEEKGTVSVSVDLAEEMHLEAYFHVEGGKITGFLAGNNDLAVTKLERVADKFSDAVQNKTEHGWSVEHLPVVNKQDNIVSHRKQTSVNREVPGGEEAYKDVDNTELYRIAKVFLEAAQSS